MMEREAMSQGSLQLLGFMVNTKKHKKQGLSPSVPNKMALVFVHKQYVEPQECCKEIKCRIKEFLKLDNMHTTYSFIFLSIF